MDTPPKTTIGRAQAGIAVLAVLGASACGGARPRNVPDVTGERLNVAEDLLDARDLRYETVGGGAFGVVVRSRWVVCRQSPRAGARARKVVLYVERSCPPAAPAAVPDVVGESLEDARELAEDRGLEVEVVGGGEHGVLVEHFWRVCEQDPAPGERARVVELYVERDCDDW